MKKYLLFLVSLFAIIMLASCDTSELVFYNHEYHIAYDDTYHFLECDCGDITKKEEHKLNKEVIKEASCTEKGEIKYYCECGYSKIEETPMLEHTYDDWETSIEATCLSQGQLKHSCINCGHTEYKDTAKASHTETKYEDLDSDCTHEGHIGGTYCSVCHEELTPSTIVSKKEHSYDKWETSIKATCISKGQEKRVCKICGHEDYRDVPMIPHTPVSYDTVDSTCKDQGHTGGYYCEFCKQKLEEPTDLPLGNHKYDIITINKEATINDKGVRTYTCSVCGDSYDEEIERTPLTQTIWDNSLILGSFNDSCIEFTYMEFLNDIYYDITFMNKNNISYIRIYDHNSYKTYEYYISGNEIVESWLDGYRHEKYASIDDIYYKFQRVLVLSVHYSSLVYDKVSYDETNKCFIAQNINIKNFNNEEELAMVSIKLDDDGNIKEYGYASDNYFINLQSITGSSTINIPNAKYHKIDSDGSCEICNEKYDCYTVANDKFDLSYYINKNDNSIGFDYSLKDNVKDVTFLNPTYDNTNDIKRFTSLYYEGLIPIVDDIKSFTLNNGLLKITYKDNTLKRFLLLKDYTLVEVSSDSVTDSNKYTGDVSNKTFKITLDGVINEFYFNSTTELELSRYNQINYYIVNGKDLINYTDNDLNKILGYYNADSNAIRHNGDKGNITFILNENLTLDIYYGGITNSNKPFTSVKFLDIKGSYKNYSIYFMGDNENYVLTKINNKIEIKQI